MEFSTAARARTSRCTRLDLSSRAASRQVTAWGRASTASMPGLRLMSAMMQETHCTCTSSSFARCVARVCRWEGTSSYAPYCMPAMCHVPTVHLPCTYRYTCECESTSSSACAPSRARKDANQLLDGGWLSSTWPVDRGAVGIAIGGARDEEGEGRGGRGARRVRGGHWFEAVPRGVSRRVWWADA